MNTIVNGKNYALASRVATKDSLQLKLTTFASLEGAINDFRDADSIVIYENGKKTNEYANLTFLQATFTGSSLTIGYYIGTDTDKKIAQLRADISTLSDGLEITSEMASETSSALPDIVEMLSAINDSVLEIAEIILPMDDESEEE